MPGSVQQYQLGEKDGSFKLSSVPYPTPEPSEVCIRTKAIGLNPLDWKSQKWGLMISSWPTVLGVDVAGVIDAVGSDVKDFKVGDEVFALCGLNNRAGAYQEVLAVPSFQVAKKPALLTFEEAASLPICFVTGAAAVQIGIGTQLPFIQSSSKADLKSVLVLGGSSAVGGAAIQLLRASLPHATILTTSSAAHHSHLVSLGASKAFERAAQDDTSAIRAATPDGAGVDAIVDTVGAAAAQPNVFSAFKSDGPKLYGQVITGQDPPVPAGVNATQVFGRALFNVPGGTSTFPALAKMIENGQYRLPGKVEVAGKGFKAIDAGLVKLQKGVSGTKVVVSL